MNKLSILALLSSTLISCDVGNETAVNDPCDASKLQHLVGKGMNDDIGHLSVQLLVDNMFETYERKKGAPPSAPKGQLLVEIGEPDLETGKITRVYCK